MHRRSAYVDRLLEEHSENGLSGFIHDLELVEAGWRLSSRYRRRHQLACAQHSFGAGFRQRRKLLTVPILEEFVALSDVHMKAGHMILHREWRSEHRFVLSLSQGKLCRIELNARGLVNCTVARIARE